MKIDNESKRAKDTVLGGERVEICVVTDAETQWQAQELPLDIVYEDDAIIVINKAAGMVVHPGAGNVDNTMSNALLHEYPELEAVPRAGVVHRLDKDTSGLLVIARTLVAQKSLVDQLQARRFIREYRALAQGVMTAGGTVDEPIGRHRVNRLKMAVVSNGKQAITHYRVLERFKAHTYIAVQLETGRTHQIRVHMAHIRYPLVGDALYGGRLQIPRACSEELIDTLRGFKRQALHAWRLGLEHPISGKLLHWEAQLPEDMVILLDALRRDFTDTKHNEKL